MNFEQGLLIELESISGLENKVYPLIAKEGAETPFLIYRKTNLEPKKTLDGSITKYSAAYEIVLITESYEELQSMSVLLEAQLLSLLYRPIGITGPLIHNLSVRNVGDKFEFEPKYYRADYSLEINY